MALLADSGIISSFRQVTDWMANAAESLLGARPRLPGDPVETVAMIDPLLRPRVKMSHEGIDLNTLVDMGKLGYRNGKLVTAQTHPELLKAWGMEAARAGLTRAPQLIIVESRTPNAAAVSPNEVILTTGLLKIMNFRDVVSILGHELGHEKNDHITPRVIAKGLFVAIGVVLGNAVGYAGGLGVLAQRSSKVSNLFTRAMTRVFGSEPRSVSALGYIFYMISSGYLGNIIANQISVKPTELQADIDGAAISGDPLGAAHALKKLGESQKSQSSFKRMFNYLISGYPTIDQRVDNLKKIAEITPLKPIIYQVNIDSKPEHKINKCVSLSRMQVSYDNSQLTKSL